MSSISHCISHCISTGDKSQHFVADNEESNFHPQILPPFPVNSQIHNALCAETHIPPCDWHRHITINSIAGQSTNYRALVVVSTCSFSIGCGSPVSQLLPCPDRDKSLFTATTRQLQLFHLPFRIGTCETFRSTFFSPSLFPNSPSSKGSTRGVL